MAHEDPRTWLVPWLTQNRGRLEKAIGLQITRPLDKPYGCGTYGCVYPLSDPRYVLKVSDDPYEGPLNKTVIDTRKRADGGSGMGPSGTLPGIVFYRNLFADQSFGKPVYVIVREDVEPFTYEDVLNMQWYYHPLKSAEPTNPLDVTSDVIDDFFDSRSPKKIAESFDLWLEWVGHVGVDLPLVADAMLGMLEKKIVLRDVHWGNVGKSTVDWGKKYRPPGTVVIHDLGLTRTEGRLRPLPDGAESQQRPRIVGNLMQRALGDLFKKENVRSAPPGMRFDGRQLAGWPDVRFTVQGATETSKPWIRADWKSTGETWTAELLNGRNPREPHRVA